MKVSKTQFINLTRCNRFAALNETYRNKEKSVIAFTDDPELNDLISEETRARKKALIGEMFDEADNDLIAVANEQMETMMPYYQEIEQIAGRLIEKRYPGKIVYDTETYKQKRFSYEKEGFHFYCFLDGYQEDEDTIRIFEVKATTTTKFFDLEYKHDEYGKKSIFSISPEGNLILDETHIEVNDHYWKKRRKLKEKIGDTGRYVYDIAYQALVLRHALKTKKKVKYYLAVLNSEYVYDGKQDETGKPLYKDDIIKFIDVTPVVLEMVDQLEKDQDTVIRNLNTMNADAVPLGKHCQRKDVRQCMFYNICYNKLEQNNNPFIYLTPQTKFMNDDEDKLTAYDLVNQGYLKATDVPTKWLMRKDREIQKQTILTNEPYIDKNKIVDGIKELKYPIYHLDFETFPCPLPRFKGEKPYAQSVIQFSIHIEKEPGVCDYTKDNVSFLAGTHDDQRKELAMKLIETIKDDGGSVLTFNRGFEKGVIKNLALTFPEYEEQLLKIADRLFDLLHLLRGNGEFYKSLGYEEAEAKLFNYYHKDLAGSFSIKKVLPVFTDLNYKSLVVTNGVDAMITYAKFPMMTKEEHQVMYQHLIDYCMLDTWAMLKILEGLKALVEA